MKIIIATGIFPPEIGGPAQYAKEIADEFRRQGHQVSVLSYRLEKRIPTGIRHVFFFLRMLCRLVRSDLVIALDTFSVGLPAVLAAKIFRKKIIIRTGGDFLWEGYVERTGDLVLFRHFYDLRKNALNFKERLIFRLTRWTLQNVSAIAFSTEWQKNIFTKAYDLDPAKNFIVENYYGPKIEGGMPQEKNFVGATRSLKWKNHDALREAFAMAKKENPGIILDQKSLPYEAFLQKIARSYAVILVSLGDISPNMILDAIRANTPFIVTEENGLMPRIKDIGIFVDPKNLDDIQEKILWLADEKNREAMREKISGFTFTHTWEEICREFIAISQKI